MMAVKSYKDLQIWGKTDLVFSMVCEDVNKWPNTVIARAIASQLLSSTGSMSANIAEGYGRGGPREFERFLLICRGSMAETDNWLFKANKQGLISNQRYKEYQSLIEEISKMTSSFIGKLRQQEKRKAK